MPGIGLGTVAEEVRRSTLQVISRDESASGSAVAVARGLAITNAHVVQGRSDFRVRLWNGDVLDAAVAKQDLRRDLALLRIRDSQEPAPILRDSSSVRPGEMVVAIGNPLGFIGALSTGVVRALGPVPGLGARDWIQADIRLAPGNSGGPLADSHGRVIGLNTMICNGIGLAVPASVMQQFLSARAPFHLGVTVRAVTLPTGERGVLILEIEPGSPAERASLLPGDLLVGIGLRRIQSVEDLGDALQVADDPVTVLFLRGGHERVRQTVARSALAAETAA